MIYRLLAINLDSALLSSKGKLHKITRASLREVASKGVEIVLFTSFSYQHAIKLVRGLPCKPFIIANQGGYIAEKVTNPFFAKRISESNTLDIVRLLESIDCHIRIFHDDCTVANTIHFPSKSNAKIQWSSGDLTFYTQQYVESLVEHLIVEPLAPQQIDVYFEEQEDKEDVLLALNAIFDGIMIQDEADGMIRIFPEQMNFVSALKYLANKLDIRAEQMVVIGSEPQDAAMVEMAGIGVALANSSLEVKNVADWITRSNDELGVAYVIREVFRKQQPVEFLKKIKQQ